MNDPADMTDAELCEAVAREVIGICGGRKEIKKGAPPPMASNAPRYAWCPVCECKWSENGPHGLYPRLDWSGIGQVVEALREEGLRLIYDGLNDVAVFARESDAQVSGGGGVVNPNPTRAVFIAALKAVRSVRE